MNSGPDGRVQLRQDAQTVRVSPPFSGVIPPSGRRWRDKERDEEFFVVYDGVMHSFRFLLGASSEMTRFISFAFGVKTGLYLKSALPCNTMADVIIEQD